MNIDLPDLTNTADTAKALAALVVATTSGELTPAEAKTFGGVIEMFGKVQEIQALTERLAAVEDELRGRTS